MPIKRNLFAALLTSLCVGIPTSAMAQKYCPPCPQNCPPQWNRPAAPQDDWKPAPAPSHDEPAPAPSMSDAPPSPESPQAPPQDFQPSAPQTAQPSFNPSTSQTSTAATSPQATAPGMIGDYFGSGGTAGLIGGLPYFGANPAAAGGNVGRQKTSENTSPIPRDRVFLNYSLFNSTGLNENPGTNTGAATIHRFTPGFEKTFQDGDMSFEMRFPFASTLDSSFSADGTADTDEVEMGDLTIFLKSLLYNTNTMAYSAGLGFSFPTHDDFESGSVIVESNAIHVLPYLAALYTPNDQFYAQSYLQFDVDLNGNDVYIGGTSVGRLEDATAMFFSLGVGYWIYQDFYGTGYVRGIAPTAEMHWNRTLGSGDVYSDGGSNVFGATDNIDLIDAVLGVNMLVGDSSILTAGYGLPLNVNDKQFEGEFRLSLNILFGPQTRQTVSQF